MHLLVEWRCVLQLSLRQIFPCVRVCGERESNRERERERPMLDRGALPRARAVGIRLSVTNGSCTEVTPKYKLRFH